MKTEQEEIGILQRRKIEAEIIKPIYELIKKEYGQQKARSIIEQAVAQSAIQAGKEFAIKENGKTSIESFVALQYLWEKDDALETEILAQDSTQYEYKVKKCRYAEMYREMGLGEIGFLLSCNRDEKFIQGYAPHVKLSRPHTLMEGHNFCDFHYQVERQEKKKDHDK